MRTFFKVMLCLPFFIAMAGASAQEEIPSLEEITESCMQYAQEEQISEEEFDEYVADCIEIEADSYGIPYDAGDSETE